MPDDGAPMPAPPAPEAPFPYMRWAKACLDKTDPKSLGLSGVARPSAGAVPGLEPVDPAEVAARHVAWRQGLAAWLGLPPAAVLPALGTSHANFLVYLTFARGRHVAAETPTYEALHRTAPVVGATFAPFRRDPARGWRIDLRDLEAATPAGTRLLAVTDLHNPSGARLDPGDLDRLIAVAEQRDAVVLVDEVYLDLDPRDRPSAIHRHPRVLVTSSLTKAHGLWDARAGWVAGDPARIAALEVVDDLVCPSHPSAALPEATAYLRHARARLAVVRERCARATERVDAWVASREDVRWTRPEAGFTGFLRLGPRGHPIDGEALAREAWESARVRVVPGRFFQTNDAVRISYLLDEARLEQALAGLGRALDRLA